MIIQSKSGSRGLALAAGQFSARQFSARQFSVRQCALAILCGALAAACSGTIDTPTDEFPERQEDDTAETASRPAAATRPTAAAAPTGAAPTGAAAAPTGAAPTPAAATPTPSAPAPEAASPTPEAPAPAGDLSFESDIWPIFQASCSPCHQSLGSGGQNIGSDDLDEALADSKSFEDAVLADLESGSMPLGCGGPPGSGGSCVSEEDYAAIEAWYDSGAPE